jgi:hypothetical protein
MDKGKVVATGGLNGLASRHRPQHYESCWKILTIDFISLNPNTYRAFCTTEHNKSE